MQEAGIKSILGYSQGSPYQNDPFIDIFTPGGLIDMSNTPKDLIGIDNLGNVKKMKAGRKNPYKFSGTSVREIPMQLGGNSMAQANLARMQAGIKPMSNAPIERPYQSGTSETATNLGRNLASYFLGVKNSSLIPSQYRPTKATDPNSQYYTWQYLKNDVKQDLMGDIYVGNVNAQQDNFLKQRPDYTPTYIRDRNFDSYYNYLSNSPRSGTVSGSSVNLGHYNISPGKDERGRYLGVYDKYDWNLLEGLGFNGNAWETYDRIYEDEWDKIPTKKKTGGLSSSKAQEMLNDGTANGKKLTKKQKKYFQAIAHGWKPNPYQVGGSFNDLFSYLFEDEEDTQSSKTVPTAPTTDDLDAREEELNRRQRDLEDLEQYNLAMQVANEEFSPNNPYVRQMRRGTQTNEDPEQDVNPYVVQTQNDLMSRYNLGNLGIWGDASHQRRKSDHNTGDAQDFNFDTHETADKAIADLMQNYKTRNVKYIIYNGRIWNPSISPEWRLYEGSNPHKTHFHVSYNR